MSEFRICWNDGHENQLRGEQRRTRVSALVPLQLVRARESSAAVWEVTQVRLLTCKRNRSHYRHRHLNASKCHICIGRQVRKCEQEFNALPYKAEHQKSILESEAKKFVLSPVCLRPCICRWDSLKYLLLQPGWAHTNGRFSLASDVLPAGGAIPGTRRTSLKAKHEEDRWIWCRGVDLFKHICKVAMHFSLWVCCLRLTWSPLKTLCVCMWYWALTSMGGGGTGGSLS